MSVPTLFHEISKLRMALGELQESGNILGLVPTMGALHAGHLSLISTALEQCDAVIVSIFVNPTQFGPSEDYSKYPRTLSEDLAQLENLPNKNHKPIYVFTPSPEEMYPLHYGTWVVPEVAASPLEGSCRPGHFRGVDTVVLKLFNITHADIAYFGQKDFQQVQVIRQMVRDLNHTIRIITCPTVREPSGLALSSRNRYLSAEARDRAQVLYKSLVFAQECVKKGIYQVDLIQEKMHSILECHPENQVEYIAFTDPDTLKEVTEITGPTAVLLAVRVSGTRLIDNCILEPAPLAEEPWKN